MAQGPDAHLLAALHGSFTCLVMHDTRHEAQRCVTFHLEHNLQAQLLTVLTAMLITLQGPEVALTRSQKAALEGCYVGEVRHRWVAQKYLPLS
jgi:hypothetical protein